MLTLPNVSTQDNYVPALTLGPVATCRGIKYVVGNAAVLAQVAPLSKSGTLEDWGQELLITPETNSITQVGGIRFRSALPGVPAQVVAQLYFPADPQFGSGTPFTGTLSPSGGVTPGVSSVRVQKNGVLIGTEPTLDFVDTNGLVWTIADDVANTRITLSALAAIFDQTLAAPAANFDIPNIPQTGSTLIIDVYGRSDFAGPYGSPLLRFNNDAGANYDFQGVSASGAAVGGFQSFGATSIGTFSVPAGTAPANTFGACRIIIPNYSGAANHKGVTTANGAKSTNAAGGIREETGAGWWRNTAAINRVTIVGDGNFVAGSRVVVKVEA